MSLGTAGAQGGPSAPDDEELYPQNVCPCVFLGQHHQEVPRAVEVAVLE